MKIKCVRCEKEIENANAENAKYVINTSDVRTFGFTDREKIINAPLSKIRVKDIMMKIEMIENISSIKHNHAEFNQSDINDYINQQYEFKLSEFDKLEEIFPDEYGRREVIIKEQIEVPKTAIICKDCLQEVDEIIW